MGLLIEKNGICDTIQDYGRFGFANNGINPSGVMDKLAMQTANALVANPLELPVLEMHFPAPAIRFETDAMIAISGANFSAEILFTNEEKIDLPLNKPALIKAGTSILFTNKLQGERCYLAAHGGFAINNWLGSFSTNIMIHAGGVHGGKLKKDDRIPLHKTIAVNEFRLFSFLANIQSWYKGNLFNILTGCHWDYLDGSSKKNALCKPFTILPESNRMGMQLKGMTLHQQNKSDPNSAGVAFGSIQLLPEGQLVILMADRGLTGGYPAIGNIISAHLPRLAQMWPGEQILFALTTQQKAEELYRLQQKEIKIMQAAVKLQLGQELEL